MVMDINKIMESGRIEEIYGHDPELIKYQKERYERAYAGYKEHF